LHPKGPFPTNPPETTPPTVLFAYTEAYQAECRNIWKIADADGLLWDTDWLESGGSPVTECYKLENPLYGHFYNTVDDARIGAVTDADSDMTDWTMSGTLINTSRTKTWSAPGA
jgi:hypothetical protein